ncbi:MAG: hypothetical protein H6733_15965 [Alphaproteobacteria bacterium]|nr:hypothetical protein [Alphaproteobacteria bacterium]
MPILLLWLTLARAQDPDVLQRHLALAEASMKAERRGDPAEAVAACTEAVDVLPTGPRAQRCVDRLAFLAARRDTDGSYAGWQELEAVRRARRSLTQAEARGRVIALLSREGIAASTVAEATIWLASEALDMDGDPQRALDVIAPLYARRASLADALRKRTVMLQARALAELGRSEEALGVETEIAVAAPMPRPTPVQAVMHDQAVGRRNVAAAAILLGFAILAAPLAVRGARRRPVPMGLVPLWLAIGLAWWVAESWDVGAGRALLPMGAGFTGVHLLAVLARTADAPAVLRGLVAFAAAAATFAVAWLALAFTGTLGWVGL